MAWQHIIDPQMGYYRYVVFTIYSIEAIAVLIFSGIQLWAFYASLRTAKILQTAANSVYPSGSHNSSKPTTEQKPPGSPRSATSRTASLRRMNSKSNSSTGGSTYSKSHKTESRFVYILPLLCFSLYFLSAICAMLTVWGVPMCWLYCQIGPSVYLTAKSCMYLLFVYRLYIVYSDSAFAYSSKVLVVFASFIVIYTMIMAVFNYATMGTVVYYNTLGERTCAGVMNSISGGIIILFDTIISFVCCYMFIKPLLVLNKFDDNPDDKLYQIILKYLILTSVAVVTTQLMMAVMLTIQFISVVCIDVIINCICLLFFNRRYHSRYKKVCCGAISICRLMFNKKKKKKPVTETKTQTKMSNLCTRDTSKAPTLTRPASISSHEEDESKHDTVNFEQMEADRNMQRLTSETDFVYSAHAESPPAPSPSPPPIIADVKHGDDDDGANGTAHQKQPEDHDHVVEVHDHAVEMQLDHNEPEDIAPMEMKAMQSHHGYVESTAL